MDKKHVFLSILDFLYYLNISSTLASYYRNEYSFYFYKFFFHIFSFSRPTNRNAEILIDWQTWSVPNIFLCYLLLSNTKEIIWYNIMEVRYMNKSSSLIDIFIIYAIEILCNINIDIIINININIILDIAVI